jgi:putative acetyltransferase
VQSTGYIDHFFVSGRHPRRGFGSLLMEQIFAHAESGDAPALTSHVSRTTQPFFAKFAFAVLQQRFLEVRGVVIPKALMSRRLK